MFKLDSPLIIFLNKVADIIILNILFIIFSIPVFTIGASFSAAYYIGFKMVRDEETYIAKGFFKAFRENFRQATIIWFFMLLIASVIVVDYRIMVYSGIEFAQWIRIAVVVVTVILLMGAVFMFPLQARFVNPVKNTIKNAFLMALSHLPISCILIIIYALPVLLLYFVPRSFPVVLFMGFGAVIYVKSFFVLKVFKRYEDELTDKSGGSTEENNDDSGIFAESERMEQAENGIVDESNVPTKVFRDGRFVELSENSGEDNVIN